MGVMTLADPPAASPLNRGSFYRLSVGQYHAMIDGAILKPDANAELLYGPLVRKLSKTPPHSTARTKLLRLLQAAVGETVRAQVPITLGDGDGEPDIAVVRGRAEDYATRHPAPAEVESVIEVADASLQTDRGVKLHGYARAGIKAYWIVNLTHRTIEVYTRPSASTTLDQAVEDLQQAGAQRDAGYGERRVYGPGELIPHAVADRAASVPADVVLP